ncbi:MAG: SCO6745 family protein [Ilumatobacteraceae bacterium]
MTHSDALGDQDWFDITRRNARSVQTTIGWIFWDPGAVRRYADLGLPEHLAGPLGYMAARGAPLAGAGPEAVIAAFGSISPLAIRGVFGLLGPSERFRDFWQARDEAVVAGLRDHASDIIEPLSELGPVLWPVVEQLPVVGRTFYAAHLSMPRSEDPLLSGWHAVNCLREWRGDTHWAVVVSEGLTHPEASILHNAWMQYEEDWLPKSRGTSAEDLDAGWEALQAKGLATGRVVSPEGLTVRRRVEDRTDELTTLPWRLLGEERSRWFAEAFEPPCELLLRRVDDTAGPNYQPASRVRSWDR